MVISVVVEAEGCHFLGPQVVLGNIRLVNPVVVVVETILTPAHPVLQSEEPTLTLPQLPEEMERKLKHTNTKPVSELTAPKSL